MGIFALDHRDLGTESVTVILKHYFLEVITHKMLLTVQVQWLESWHFSLLDQRSNFSMVTVRMRVVGINSILAFCTLLI